MISNWKDFLEHEKNIPYFKDLQSSLLKEEKEGKIIYPPKEDIYNAFKLCAPKNVRVVILAQDPYHGANQANGLAFSVREGQSLPPSLKNIFKELKNDLNIINTKGDLAHWAQQGVLLLNASLTVRSGEANSHQHLGWQLFTNNVIKYLNTLDQPIVYVLWGSNARSKKSLLNNPKHLIIESAHPSPLSAHNGFFGSKPFSKVNEYLVNNNLYPIDWQIV